MAVRPIVRLGQSGDEVLRRPADPVTTIDGSLQMLIDDMIDTVRAAPGVGLAAPQVGVSLRLIVLNVTGIPPFAVLNAEVVRHGGRRWVEEGCLSIPGYRGELFRSVRVTVAGLDRQGRRIRIRAVDDVLAQALEHEIDHTNGLLYIDRISGDEHLHRTRREEDEEIAAPGEVLPEELIEEPQPVRRRGRSPFITRPKRRHAERVADVRELLRRRAAYRA
ncbi:MAG TPA: peptide deformylase [Dehalococcoidia bacterium]|jgi:peptide deformylase|nr:peptide deformylase [Dehalococcoidia bacterium]